MLHRVSILLAAVIGLATFSLPAGEPDLKIDAGRLRAHIETLASLEFSGRRGAGAQKTAEYLARRFQAHQLQPAFGQDGFCQPIVLDPQTGQVAGVNVAALIPGKSPDEYIVLSAHFDHLGVVDGTHFPGADDNATGVSLVLEAARLLSQLPPAKRSILLVGFDLEESGLLGSRYFAAHPPRPIEQLALFITADMIGRNGGGLTRNFLFVAGSEHVPDYRKDLLGGAKNRLELAFLGADLIGPRSDFAPFGKRKVPFLFFSTGVHPDYHRATDTADKIDYAKAAKVSELVVRSVRHWADAQQLPKWQDEPQIDLAEVKMAHQIIQRLLETPGGLKPGSSDRFLATQARRALEVVLDRGELTAEERTQLVSLCRLLLGNYVK